MTCAQDVGIVAGVAFNGVPLGQSVVSRVKSLYADASSSKHAVKCLLLLAWKYEILRGANGGPVTPAMLGCNQEVPKKARTSGGLSAGAHWLGICIAIRDETDSRVDAVGQRMLLNQERLTKYPALRLKDIEYYHQRRLDHRRRGAPSGRRFEPRRQGDGRDHLENRGEPRAHLR